MESKKDILFRRRKCRVWWMRMDKYPELYRQLEDLMEYRLCIDCDTTTGKRIVPVEKSLFREIWDILTGKI